MTPIQKAIEEFRAEYRKAYAGILPDEVLEKGNVWFEERLQSAYRQGRKDAVNEMNKGHHKKCCIGSCKRIARRGDFCVKCGENLQASTDHLNAFFNSPKVVDAINKVLNAK